MSQEASTHRIDSASEDFYSSQPWSLDNYADGLMDELFSDIDEILDGSGNLPSEPVQPEYVSLQPITVPPIVLSPTLLPPQQIYHQPGANQLSTVVVDTSSLTIPPQRRSNSLGKILLVLASVSVVLALGWWLAIQGGNRQITPAQVPVPATPKLSASEVYAQFADYALRALEILDQKQASTSQKVAAAPPTQPPANQPTANTPSNQPQVVTRQTVLERVYIPVYQPPPPVSYAPPTLPTLAARPRTAAQVRTAPSPARSAAPVRTAPSPARSAAPVRTAPSPARTTAPVKTAPSPARTTAPVKTAPSPARTTAPVRQAPARPVIVAPQPLPQPAPQPALPPPPQTIPQIPTPVSTKNTLVGVLETGDKSKSAALFEVEGSTRRIQVGESIGASGWTLVEVSNGEAIIRRNGEVRSVYAGQKF